jgi:hypothetical protein
MAPWQCSTITAESGDGVVLNPSTRISIAAPGKAAMKLEPPQRHPAF